MSLLMELRPAAAGFSGIPQETRVLFSRLARSEALGVSGLLNGNAFHLRTRKFRKALKAAPGRRLFYASQSVLDLRASIEGPDGPIWPPAVRLAKRVRDVLQLRLKTDFGIPLDIERAEVASFFDYIWASHFAKSLGASDFDRLQERDYYVMSDSWQAMVWMSTQMRFRPRFPMLRIRDHKFYLSQTPVPARIVGSQLLVRYHDAIPVTFPHTVHSARIHQVGHYWAMKSNLDHGAIAVCNSESTRRELLSLFPNREEQTEVIPCAVSETFAEDDSETVSIPEIVRGSLEPTTAPAFRTPSDLSRFYARHVRPDMRYLLMVSTIEPRKNHSRLISAWKSLIINEGSDLKLILVGRPGWLCEDVLSKMAPFQARGMIFNLASVTPNELRALYRNAEATVCPSIAEGFDLSGVEAMMAGGVVVASDIPVHREAYGQAPLYFNPYSTQSLVNALTEVTSAKADKAAIIEAGRAEAAKYRSEVIGDRWEGLLDRLGAADFRLPSRAGEARQAQLQFAK